MLIFVVAVSAMYFAHFLTLPTCHCKKFQENLDQDQDQDNIANLVNSGLPMAAISKMFCLYFSKANRLISIKFGGQMRNFIPRMVTK